MTFDTYYASHPWEKINELTQHIEYSPILADIYMRKAIYSMFAQTVIDLGGMNSQEYVETGIIPPRPTTGEKSARNLWYTSERIDSYSRSISYSNYGGKLAFTEYDNIGFWYRQGSSGLAEIVKRFMGQMVVDSLDIIARNAILSHPAPRYIGNTDKFAGIGSNDKMTSDMVRDIWLAMTSRDRLWQALPDPYTMPNMLIAITTPGVVFDLQNEAANTNKTDFINVQRDANPGLLLKHAFRQYLDVLWIVTPLALLRNCGDITAQTTMTASVAAGSGADQTVNVYGTYSVGQDSTEVSIVNYVTVASSASFAVGDVVTLHNARTSAYGVTNGVDFKNADNVTEEIVAIPSGTRIVLKRPLPIDFTTDLGSGVYGYVTKGVNIHSTSFIGDTTGLRRAIYQPPVIMAPPTVDDAMEVKRLTWKSRHGDKIWTPEVIEQVFSHGSSSYGFSAVTRG